MTESTWPDPTRKGVPLNPERDGWHWLVPSINHALPPGAYRWHAPLRPDVIGQWDAGYPQDVVRRGYDYLGPCLTPSEVAAQIAAAKAEGMREAAGILRARHRGLERLLEYVEAQHAADEIEAAILAATPEPQP